MTYHGPVEALFNTLEALSKGPHRRRGGGSPELPATAPVDDALSTWVTWLIARYGLTNKIPTKWPDVPGVPDDLAPLRAAWLYAFNAETAAPLDGFEATQWHDTLMRVLGRIEVVWRSEDRARRRASSGESGGDPLGLASRRATSGATTREAISCSQR